MSEPYETMPEGEPHAAADYITRLLAGLLLAMIVLVAAACPAPAHAAENWCSQWADGFEVGYCWRKAECDYIPPQVCPAPVSESEDPYMTGLRDGLAAGRVEI